MAAAYKQRVRRCAARLDQATRQAALNRVRRALERLPATTGPSQGAAGQGADGREAPAWLVRTDQRLDGYQARTRRALRDTLTQSIRVSPYGIIEARDLRTLRPADQSGIKALKALINRVIAAGELS